MEMERHPWGSLPAMPSVDINFRTAAIASGLVTPAQLDYVFRLARHRLNAGPDLAPEAIPDRLLSEIFIEQSLLTRYQADQLSAGRTKLSLGPYLVTEWIGQGGMGQVFKAVHQVMGRECAIKVLPLHRVTPETLSSFIREIRLQARLDCPYLVRAFDAGQDGNVHYLVTEYVQGMDLRRLVKSRGPLPIHQAAGIVMQAAMGLEYAHQKGMIHRDVKPGNILVTPEGMAKVSDVGLAGFARDLSDDPRAGKIVGTADYLSPEQIRSPMEITTVSDIYSLGCTLYYAVCGKVPFPGGDAASKIRRHLGETPWHPRKFQPDLTEEFVDIIADMMEKNPRERIQTCGEIVARLEPWAGDAGNLTSTRMTRGPWAAPPPTLEHPIDIADDGAMDSTGHSTEASQLTRSLQAAAHSPASSSGAMVPPSAPPIQATPTSATPGNPPRGLPSLPGLPANSAVPTSPPPASWLGTHPWLLVAITAAILLPPALAIGGILGFLFRDYFYGGS